MWVRLTINDAIGEGGVVDVDLVGREVDILDGGCLCEGELEDGGLQRHVLPGTRQVLAEEGTGTCPILQLDGILEALLVGGIIQHKNIQELPAAVEVINANVKVHLLISLSMLGALGVCEEIQLQIVHSIHHQVVQEDAHRLSL